MWAAKGVAVAAKGKRSNQAYTSRFTGVSAMKFRFACVTSVVAAVVFLTPLTSFAQNAELEEILVTATRRGETDILTTPIAMTALSGDAIETFGWRDLNDIAMAVPGLSSGTVSAFKSAQFAMRGVAETTIILYKESPVGVTIDDFVVPHIQTSNLELFDIEAIEVLRGPQGTLFGKNTTGGVINVRTKRPVLNEGSGSVSLRLAEYGTRKMNMALNLPLVDDTLAFRLAWMYLQSDGYYKNNAVFGPLGAVVPVDPAYQGVSGSGDGSKIGGDDVFSGRAKLLWQPTENFNALFQYEMVRDNGDSPPIVAESGPGYVFPLWGYPAATGDPIDNAGSTLRDDLGLNMTGGHQVDINGYYLNTELDIGSYTVYANVGYRDQESRLPSSYTGSTGPQSLFDATRDDNRETTQAEIRLASQSDGPLNFVVGGFYQSDDTKFCVLQVVGFLDNFFLGTPSGFFNTNPLILCNRQDAETFAGFVDGTYDLTDSLHLTAGLRYTHEKKAWAGRPRVNIFALDGAPALSDLSEPLEAADFDRFPTGVVRDSKSWSEPTYRLNLSYDFNDDLFGFATYSRGFKSGGYNDQLGTQLNPITALAAQPTEPEIADSFEVGLKARVGNSATVAVNVFQVEYEDAQRTFNVSFPSGGQETLFFNAAEMTVTGAEFEGTWSVNDALSLRATGAWLDAEFDKFEADTNYDGVIDVDLSGKPPQRAPEWQWMVEGLYEHAVSSYGNLEWNVRVSYEDDNIAGYSDVDPQFDAILNSKTLIDASVTFTDPDDSYYVRFYGDNLSDERYRTGSLSVATLWVMTAYGQPRTFGIEGGVKFDW